MNDTKNSIINKEKPPTQTVRPVGIASTMKIQQPVKNKE